MADRFNKDRKKRAAEWDAAIEAAVIVVAHSHAKHLDVVDSIEAIRALKRETHDN